VNYLLAPVTLKQNQKKRGFVRQITDEAAPDSPVDWFRFISATALSRRSLSAILACINLKHVRCCKVQQPTIGILPQVSIH
jgi:hypothetical protein